jgi:hypothetical protein
MFVVSLSTITSVSHFVPFQLVFEQREHRLKPFGQAMLLFWELGEGALIHPELVRVAWHVNRSVRKTGVLSGALLISLRIWSGWKCETITLVICSGLIPAAAMLAIIAPAVG